MRAAGVCWKVVLATGMAVAGLGALPVLDGCSSTGGGSTATPPAETTVAPAITSQPSAQTANVGQSATFTVVASGTPAPTFQWTRNGTAISGATSASYTTPTLSMGDDGSSFAVVVTNSAGTVTSAAVRLSVVVVAPAVTQNPANVTAVSGASASFSVSATGSAPLLYQWLRNGAAIAGANGASYTLAPVATTDSGSVFAVTVSNSAGTVTSSPATLVVNAPAPTIATQPAGALQFVGETATFTVSARGPALSYQWRRGGIAIAGATAASYTTPVLAATDDQASFDVVVTNSGGSVSSSSATLRVGPFATSYTTQKGVTLDLYAWPGAKYAFLTKTAGIDATLMREILAAVDGAWNYYAGAIGKLPGFYKTYDGLGTIADTGVGGVDLCGDGCTYIGATGMELSDRITTDLLAHVPQQYDWVPFYETGRSFWLFHDQLEYQAPANSSCEVTGFAVFMGIHSLLGLQLPTDYGTNVANNPDPFVNERLALNSYATNPNLTFENTFEAGVFQSPYGDCPVLWTGLVQALTERYGGEAFVQGLFKQVLARPAAATTQDAVDNFVLAASAAAGKNLTTTFGTTWKWPISATAATEAQQRWGAPE